MLLNEYLKKYIFLTHHFKMKVKEGLKRVEEAYFFTLQQNETKNKSFSQKVNIYINLVLSIIKNNILVDSHSRIIGVFSNFFYSPLFNFLVFRFGDPLISEPFSTCLSVVFKKNFYIILHFESKM